MDVALSDLLTCPRCGPMYGLVLLPAEVRDRRVRAGVLGCANCRERYPVVDGVADLRVGGESAGGAAEAALGEAADRQAAVRLAALLGLAEVGGTVLLAGPAVVHAGELAELVPEASVVAVEVGAVDVGGVESGPVSWIRAGAVLPLRGGSLRGVALTGRRAELLEEGARLLGPAGRLLLDPAATGARGRVEAAGLRVLLEERGVLVGGRGQ